MGATEEQMALLVGAHVTHVAYILLIYSIAFLMFLFVAVLLHLYVTLTWPLSRENTNPFMSKTNGRPTSKRNGHARGAGSVGDAQRLRDAEEFELEGLMSDDDEPEDRLRPPAQRANPPTNPST